MARRAFERGAVVIGRMRFLVELVGLRRDLVHRAVAGNAAFARSGTFGRNSHAVAGIALHHRADHLGMVILEGHAVNFGCRGESDCHGKKSSQKERFLHFRT